MGLIEVIVDGLTRRVRVRRREGRRWVQPLGLKRILVDGKVYLVRRVLSITPTELVVVDHTGAVKTIPRGKERSAPLAYRTR